MRAVLHERYGPPEVLRVGEVERPAPGENEVLVKVLASTVTRGDAMRSVRATSLIGSATTSRRAVRATT